MPNKTPHQPSSNSSAVDDALTELRVRQRPSTARRTGISGVLKPQPAPRRLLLLMEHSLDFVGLLGAEGIIEGVSAAIKPLGGYDPKDLIGCKYQDIVNPEDRIRAADAFSRVFRGDGAETVPVRYHRMETLP